MLQLLHILLPFEIQSPGQSPSKWRTFFAHELGRLANGVGDKMKQETNTVVFIPRNKVPRGRTITYGRLVYDICPLKVQD